VLPKGIGNWSLTSLQQRLVTTGGRLVKHARYYWLLLAESHRTLPALRQHAGEDRGAAVAGGIGNPQSAADFGDEIRRESYKRLRTSSKKREFRVFWCQREAELVRCCVMEKASGLNPGARTSRLQTPGVGATVNQN
jgi:hypothetical protein